MSVFLKSGSHSLGSTTTSCDGDAKDEDGHGTHLRAPGASPWSPFLIFFNLSLISYHKLCNYNYKLYKIKIRK